MDATTAAQIIRNYFVVTLNTSAFFMEPVKSNFNPINMKWEAEVLLKPIYGGEKKFKVIINQKTEEVENVELIK
ncbi:hypothetical protein HZC30_05685 [Candidatus Woesearchaeota archaeon]|nr:hypothetical protein [Candidatus Woesearchaeota archaeon]